MGGIHLSCVCVCRCSTPEVAAVSHLDPREQADRTGSRHQQAECVCTKTCVLCSYQEPVCPSGGHGRGHRLALQNRPAARHVPLTVRTRPRRSLTHRDALLPQPLERPA